MSNAAITFSVFVSNINPYETWREELEPDPLTSTWPESRRSRCSQSKQFEMFKDTSKYFKHMILLQLKVQCVKFFLREPAIDGSLSDSLFHI